MNFNPSGYVIVQMINTQDVQMIENFKLNEKAGNSEKTILK